MFEGMKRRFGDRVERRVVAMGIEGVKYVHPVRPEDASGLVAAVYEQLGRDFQLLAPITLTSALPPLLAAVWTVLRETLVAGAVPRLEKELVAAAVSKANACPYCVAAHALMLRGGAKDDVALAVARGDTEAIEDPRLRALATWALNSRSPDHPALASLPFDQEAAPEILGTAVAFHMINRVVDVFLGDSPFAMPPGFQWTAELLMKPVASTFARRLVGLTPPPGESLRLLQDAPLPNDLQWAKPNPIVAGAFARAAHVVDQLGATLVPGEVRALVLERVAAWRGEFAGPSRRWVEEAIRPVTEPERPAARLALLTALASSQIDSGVVASFQERSSNDEALLGTVAWAAFTAARRVGTWLGGPATASRRAHERKSGDGVSTSGGRST
jgi:AhpD family alkylhydroperoxidase